MTIPYSAIIGNQLQPIMQWQQGGEVIDLYLNPHSRGYAYEVRKVDNPAHHAGGFLGPHASPAAALRLLERYVDLEHAELAFDLTTPAVAA